MSLCTLKNGVVRIDNIAFTTVSEKSLTLDVVYNDAKVQVIYYRSLEELRFDHNMLAHKMQEYNTRKEGEKEGVAILKARVAVLQSMPPLALAEMDARQVISTLFKDLPAGPTDVEVERIVQAATQK